MPFWVPSEINNVSSARLSWLIHSSRMVFNLNLNSEQRRLGKALAGEKFWLRAVALSAGCWAWLANSVHSPLTCCLLCWAQIKLVLFCEGPPGREEPPTCLTIRGGCPSLRVTAEWTSRLPPQLPEESCLHLKYNQGLPATLYTSKTFVLVLFRLWQLCSLFPLHCYRNATFFSTLDPELLFNIAWETAATSLPLPHSGLWKSSTPAGKWEVYWVRGAP